MGVAAVAIGYVIVACLKTTPWQSFAGHCVFGTNRDKGDTPWSGTNFSEWKETPEGLDIQIRALTAMLCGFKIAGEGTYGIGNSVKFAFGQLPPNARLQIQFSITLDNSTTVTPGYLIDSRTPGGGQQLGRGLWHRAARRFSHRGPPHRAHSWPRLARAQEGSQGRSILLLRRPPVWRGAGHRHGDRSGDRTIPVDGPLRYDIVEPGVIGYDHTNVLESIEAKSITPEAHAEGHAEAHAD